MDNNGYYTGISKHSNYMLPVNYQIPFDSFNDYQTSQQQQHQQQLPHQVQTTHQQHHEIQSTISVKLDTINKSPSQKTDEIQACSGGYTGNNTATLANDYHGNLYHYNKNLDNGDGIASYQTSVASNYQTDFDHGGSSIGQKSLSSFMVPQQHQQQHSQQQNPLQNQHQSQHQHPPTAAILPQAIGNVQNDISQQSKVLGTYDQRSSSKCYNNKATAATNPLQTYQQPGYKDSEMPFHYNKLPPIPQTYHHVYTPYDKYSLQPRVTTHHKPYDDNPTNSRPYVCQTMAMATNHKPTSQPELYCSSSATTEQHNRFSNRNYLIPNSAFTSPANGFFTPMYHRSNNVHRNLLPPPPSLQPAIDDSSNYFSNNSLFVRSGSYNRSQMTFQQQHHPYGRPHHPIPKLQQLQSKSDVDIMSGLTEDLYRPYNVSYDYDEFQYQQPTVTHYPTSKSKVIYAPYSSNSMNTYPPSTTNQQPPAQQQPQQQHIQPQPQQQQHHQSVIQNQVHPSSDYSRYPCSNIQPSSLNCSNKVYHQDQYSYASHPQMVYSHGTNEVAQTELPKYNQIYEKRTASSTEKLALVDLEEQITGSKILKTRELAPASSYDCSKSNYKDHYYYNYNALKQTYQQLRGCSDQDASKNQSIRDFLTTWNDDEEYDTEATSGKKANTRRITSVEVMPRSCGPNKLEMEGASNVSTTKIHFGIKVDNGGIASNNLPDIIIDIEKPKVVGNEENYSSPVTDKLYVLESIDVPLSDLNKPEYKHLRVVNKLPDNIVRIERRKGDKLDDVEETLKLIEKCEERKLPDNIVRIERRKGDNLDDVEETLKLIEKCEERVPLHKRDFELDAKFDGEVCASPIKKDCGSDVGYEQDSMLNDPLSIHETPIDADQHTVPAPSPKIERDEENSSNAHNKTADDSQDEDDIAEEVEPMNDGEVVRYKCVQKKVSTNGDELIHSDVSIPKLKIKIMRRKRSKSFRNRKIKDDNDSLDVRAVSQVDESISQVKTLKLICLDVINTDSFRKYLISMKDYESKNVFQYSGQTAIENNIECLDESKKDGEFIKELVAIKEFPSDLIENKNVHDPPFGGCQISENKRESSSIDISESNCIEMPDQSQSCKLQSTLDDEDTSHNLCNPNLTGYDCFPQHDQTIDDSSDINSLSKFKFHTPSVGEDFGDPNFETNFESIRSLNLSNDLLSVPIDSNNSNLEINHFFPLNDEMSVNADNIDQSSTPSYNVKDNTTSIEQDIEGSDKCIENIMDIQTVANLIDNLDDTPSVPANRVDASELIESLHEFEQLIGCNDEPITPEIKPTEPIVGTIASTDYIIQPSDIPRPNVYKIEPIKSDYDSSSSSCSSSDDSDDSDSDTEFDETRREQDAKTSVTTTTATTQSNQNNCIQLIDGSKIKTSNTSCSSSDESEEMNYKSSEEVCLKTNQNAKHTDSEGSCTKSSSPESVINDPKVKIESEELTTHSKSDDQISHTSDNDKSSSYSGSSSDNSDDSSSSESEEEIAFPKPIQSILKIEKESPRPEIKTEEPHSYSDATDDSSSDSYDETESETATKDAPSNDNESVKSNSCSETSDDEYVRHSPINSEINENVFETSKTSADTEPSEEEDKKSSSSNPASVLSSTENQDQDDSITESETCTDSIDTTTPVSHIRSTISEEKYIEENADVPCKADCEKRLIEDFIKTEPINEDSHVFNSSSDNSDDEYVKLSPLNHSLIGEASETQNHTRKVSQLSNKKIVINPDRNKKQVLSSDGYSTSTSSSLSSSSSSSSGSDDDEYSSDDDEVFVTKKPITFHGSDSNKKIDSIVLKPANTIKTEAEDQEEEDNSERVQILKDVEVELVQNFDNDILLDAVLDKATDSKPFVEMNQNIISTNSAHSEDTAFKYLNSNALESKTERIPDVSTETNAVDIITGSDSIMQAKLVEQNEQIYENDVVHCSANVDEIETLPVTSQEVLHNMPNVDFVRCTDEPTSERTPDQASIVQREPDVTDAVKVDLEILTNIGIDDNGSLLTSHEPINENRTDPPNFENSAEYNSEIGNCESSTVSEEIDSETLPHIDNTLLSSPSHEPMKHNIPKDLIAERLSLQTIENILMDPPTENPTRDHCDNVVSIDEKDEAVEVETNTTDGSYIDKTENKIDESESLLANSEVKPFTNVDNHFTHSEVLNANVEASTCIEEKEEEIASTIIDSPIDKHIERKSYSNTIESTIQKFLEEEKLHSLQVGKVAANKNTNYSSNAIASPTTPKDLLYPVLDIPVKLIPLPGEKFNEELYQKLIENGEIFPSRISIEIENLNDFYRDIPVEFIPLPGETFNDKSPHFIDLKRKYFENRKNSSQFKVQENVDHSLGENKLDVRNQVATERLSQSLVDQSHQSLNYANQTTLVIYNSIPSLKVLCEKILCTAGLHYEEDDENAAEIDGDNENISYSLYIVNDNDDDFWNCSNDSSSPLIVCYDGELDDEVFVDTDISVPIDDSINLSENSADLSENLADLSENLADLSETFAINSEKCSNTLQSLAIDSFTIDSHDIQYEEIVPVNRTMYKLETFKRYLQSKYIQKPNYIQTHCINKILKKYSNYQRYRMKPVQITVQKCKKRIENFKTLLKYPKSNEKSPNILATDRSKVKENGQIPKNDVLRSNCDINKSKLLLLTNNNNIKNKRNLNSTQRNDKLKESEVSTISSYVSEMTKNNHLKESRAFAKEIITNKRSIKSNATVASTPIVDKSKSNLSHCNSHDQIAILKRKVSENVAEPMTTRNNKKRKLSFDDTLLGINRIYKQNSMIVECNKTETKSSSSSYKLKERSNVHSNSNILNNSKDKVKRLIIPKSKIFDGPNVSTKKKVETLVQIPYVKLIRNPYIDNLYKNYAKNTLKPAIRK